jgi:non-homologous end joining protein Ku
MPPPGTGVLSFGLVAIPVRIHTATDPVYFENTHYLGPDKGGEKPYRLLADAMAKSGRVAIAEIVSRGKEQLVLIRPYRKGLVLHTMYYGNEVRDFKQVCPKARTSKFLERN